MNINILGDKYKLEYLDKKTKYMKKKNLGAFIDYRKRKIKVMKNQKEALIHECVHGYLFKIGLERLNNEEDVELISNIVIHLAKYVK